MGIVTFVSTRHGCTSSDSLEWSANIIYSFSDYFIKRGGQRPPALSIDLIP